MWKRKGNSRRMTHMADENSSTTPTRPGRENYGILSRLHPHPPRQIKKKLKNEKAKTLTPLTPQSLAHSPQFHWRGKAIAFTLLSVTTTQECGSLHMTPSLLYPLPPFPRSSHTARNCLARARSLDLSMACFWIHRRTRHLDQCESKQLAFFFPSLASAPLLLCSRWCIGGFQCGSIRLLFFACGIIACQKRFRFCLLIGLRLISVLRMSV